LALAALDASRCYERNAVVVEANAVVSAAHGLDKLGKRIEHARAALERGKLERQIGRLLERNARAAGRYLIELESDPARPAGVRLKWSVRPEWDDWARHSEGC